MHTSDKLVASARGPTWPEEVPLSPNESKTRFGRRGRASIVATSSRTCFRMSLTDLADSISFVVIRPAYSRTIKFHAHTREPLASIKFYEKTELAAIFKIKKECIRVRMKQ